MLMNDERTDATIRIWILIKNESVWKNERKGQNWKDVDIRMTHTPYANKFSALQFSSLHIKLHELLHKENFKIIQYSLKQRGKDVALWNY